MEYNSIQEYINYTEKVYDRYEVFIEICNKFSIKRALYPGSYIHITPSLIISEVTYIDSIKTAKKFFDYMNEILEFLDRNKIYDEKTVINFEAKDFNNDLPIPENYYDLLISQFSGFISQSCKKYLMHGGLLLANDSHGDATLAKADEDYQFIGVISKINGVYKYNDKNLEDYFSFKRKRPVDIEKVKREMKGPKYKLKSDYYIFKKI